MLNYRKHVEDRLASELADIKRKLDSEKEIARKLKRERLDLISRLKKMGECKLGVADISVYFTYIGHIKNQEKYQDEVISKVGKKLEEKRTELIDVSKKREILEIIKEKGLKTYRLYLDGRERKELDEFGVLRSGNGVKN